MSSQNASGNSQSQKNKQDGDFRSRSTRLKVGNHPISITMTLLAVLIFTVAMLLSGLNWSPTLALIALSFFIGAIVIRFAFEPGATQEESGSQQTETKSQQTPGPKQLSEQSKKQSETGHDL